ncbi:hypothetical protein FJT64_004484 [Amphibalanus amphitrite]|uniref:Uncharacterized protein n=1 Tax=Amphibalanus amphitrite TaxID=1232801 RepID=A0A6A4VX10_AMPAM|nr:hypothetical protein FJT64_004484 [Amphibalanus amphitrite]
MPWWSCRNAQVLERTVRMALLCSWIGFVVWKVTVLLSEPTGSVTRWDDDFEHPVITVCPYYVFNREARDVLHCGSEEEKELLFGNDTLLALFKREGLTLEKLLHTYPDEYLFKASPQFVEEYDGVWKSVIDYAREMTTFNLMTTFTNQELVINVDREVMPNLRRQPCEEDPAYSRRSCWKRCFMDYLSYLLADMGGYLGLLLGYSILSIFDDLKTLTRTVFCRNAQLLERTVRMALLCSWIAFVVWKVTVLLSEPTGSVTRWDNNFEQPLITVCPYHDIDKNTRHILKCGSSEEKDNLYGNLSLELVIHVDREVMPNLRRQPCEEDPSYSRSSCWRRCFFDWLYCSLNHDDDDKDKSKCLAAEVLWFKCYSPKSGFEERPENVQGKTSAPMARLRARSSYRLDSDRPAAEHSN